MSPLVVWISANSPSPSSAYWLLQPVRAMARVIRKYTFFMESILNGKFIDLKLL
jgi:hypothetical protein